jgi:hypothetical protein
VRIDAVDGDADELDVQLLELVCLTGEGDKFSRADGCEVGWVREEQYVLAFGSVVAQFDLAVGALGAEVGSGQWRLG